MCIVQVRDIWTPYHDNGISSPFSVFLCLCLFPHFTLVFLFLRLENLSTMISLSLYCVLVVFSSITAPIRAQSGSGSGYTGYSLTTEGDSESVTYSTSSTPGNVSTINPPPDVYLNASVSVNEIDITVSNLTAKINLDAQVLSLLQFNAGVTASIDRVQLLIKSVTAKVTLEARLENLVTMIEDVLDSLDLNPILATLGEDLGIVVNDTVGALSGPSSSFSARSTAQISYDIAKNVLYSSNDYSGHTHTNRVLSQTGYILDQSLDDNGSIISEKVVGSYVKDMTFNGQNASVIQNGKAAQKLEYVYAPFVGLSVISAVVVNATGGVVATQVLSESGSGGSSTIGNP